MALKTDPVVEHVAHPGLVRGELCDDDGPGPGREPADQPDGYLRVLSVRDARASSADEVVRTAWVTEADEAVVHDFPAVSGR
jgi:hypothetical protein